MSKERLAAEVTRPVDNDEQELLGLERTEGVGQTEDQKHQGWEFGEATTYHIVPHPLNPGRKRPKRQEPKPGLSVLYQTVPRSRLPKELLKAAKDPAPKFFRRLFRRPEPDCQGILKAKEELDKARGKTMGVFKPKREGSALKFWKPRPPAPKSRRICHGTRFDRVDVGSVTNKSTLLKNIYNINIDKLGLFELQHGIWKPRSPISFSHDNVRLQWKGTKHIRHPSGKEKAKWLVFLAHMKLVAYPQPKTQEIDLQEQDGENGDSKGIVLAEYVRLPAIRKLGRLRVDWTAVASVFGEGHEEELEPLLISSCTVAQIIERKRREKLRIIIEIIVDVAENAGG